MMREPSSADVTHSSQHGASARIAVRTFGRNSMMGR
jgi:hypothetical protein